MKEIETHCGNPKIMHLLIVSARWPQVMHPGIDNALTRLAGSDYQMITIDRK
jgi:hypothetical protein